MKRTLEIVVDVNFVIFLDQIIPTLDNDCSVNYKKATVCNKVRLFADITTSIKPLYV